MHNACRIRIALRGCEPECTRVLRIPGDISFLNLERAIQIVFGWSGGHAGGQIRLRPGARQQEILTMDRDRPSKFGKRRMTRTCDMGYCWDHDIGFLKNANDEVVLDRLEEKGLISQGRNKTRCKSVRIPEESVEKARELLERYGIRDWGESVGETP